MKKKSIIAGVITGLMLSIAVTSGAMSTTVVGYLHHKNPITSAPKAYAETMGFKSLTAKCTASKGGKTNSHKVSGSGPSVETDWVSGPTYASSGTKFSGVHTGYDVDGYYHSLTSSYTY